MTASGVVSYSVYKKGIDMPGPTADITMVLKVQKLRKQNLTLREIVKRLGRPETHLRQIARWAKYDIDKVVDKSLKRDKSQ